MYEAEALARSWGMRELALDTSERAPELIATYERRGYRVVGEVGRDIVNYRRVLMSKSL
jgi:DNA-binding winged helix-turn-helix (wHTH) protein